MMDLTGKRLDLERDGYIAVDHLLNDRDVAMYLRCYNKILSGEIDAGQWRSDLDSGQPKKRDGVENITQVMSPSELIPSLPASAAYERALHIVRQLLGDDMAFDFDMLIDKASGTETPTPLRMLVHGPRSRPLRCWNNR